MCGPDTSNRPRGGALAALSASPEQSHEWRGDLAFYTPGQPGGPVATHARLTAGKDSNIKDVSDAVVLIQSVYPLEFPAVHAGVLVSEGSGVWLMNPSVNSRLGDMATGPEECGLFHSFDFTQATVLTGENALELELKRPMFLEVSDVGIIGRRVSVLPPSPQAGVATRGVEGIVGFNFLHSL